MNAYPVARVPEGTVKLDAMENPFDLPAIVHERLSEEIRKLPLNRYPDGEARDLKKVLESVLNIPEERLFLGNGSDEILLNIFLATPGPILLAEPTFSMYKILADVTRRTIIGVPLAPDLNLDTGKILESASKFSPSLIVLSHPNNPTGLGIGTGDVRNLCRGFPGGILIDEAYFPFSRETLLPLQEEFPNLMILRTLSKLGLAGLRLGILAAMPGIVRELDKVRLPYNMDVVTQKAAEVVCREFFNLLEEQAGWIIALRDQFASDLSAIQGVTPIPSKANFILIRLANADADNIHRLLLEEKILVRNVSHHHPLLEGCLRVTVGTRKENGLFLAALARILKGHSHETRQ